MRIGFIIPTELESQELNEYNKHITCAGFGAGKAAACSAAAKLVYEKHCDTIIVWGLAGSLDENIQVNDIDVLKVSHHGDRNSTCKEFLEVATPEYAIISVSEDNHYGHPVPETIERIKEKNPNASKRILIKGLAEVSKEAEWKGICKGIGLYI